MNMGKYSPDHYKKMQYLADIKLQKLMETNPARLFIPNIGQERALGVYQHNNGTALGVPFIHVFGGGNGVGKTSALAIFLVGLAFGVDELNDEWYGDYFVFRKMAAIRNGKKDGRARPVKGRIVCHSDSMKEDGPVYGEIKRWFPEGRYEMIKAGKSYYSIIKCYDKEGNLTAEIGVKSHDQDKGAHAGTNLDFILCDEPMPEDLWGETVGRVRDMGFIAMFLTPLEMSAWMSKQILEDLNEKTKTVSNGSIWDNCKDIEGSRGHLTREVIENQINEWTRLSPEEVDARVNGTFTHLAGAIYKVYEPMVHFVDPFPIPNDWPIYMIMDPHPSRPPACVWYAQSPTRTFAIAEYPKEDYTQLKSTTLTIKHFCAAFDDIERRLGRKANHRYGDPNSLVVTNNNTGRDVKGEYKKYGYSFALSDDNLDLGHSLVKDHIFYNQNMVISDYNSPKHFVFNTCKNVNNSMRGYGYKKGINTGSKSERIDQKFKDFADCQRYFFMRLKIFEPATNGQNTFIKKLHGSRDKSNHFL